MEKGRAQITLRGAKTGGLRFMADRIQGQRGPVMGGGGRGTDKSVVNALFLFVILFVEFS